MVYKLGKILGKGSDCIVYELMLDNKSSGKVIKINCLVATAIGTTTGVTVNHYNSASQFTGAAATVSLASTMTVPTFSSLAVIDKTNSIYLQENEQIGVIAQTNAGTLDVVCSYEEIS